LRDFDAISVRETSGVSILKDEYNFECTHSLDPTMLLSVEEYISLFKLKIEQDTSFVFAYILDEHKSKQEIITIAETTLEIENRIVSGEEVTKRNWNRIDMNKRVTVEQWIQNFYNADFVVTDSFHGTIFSIMFNKPFIAIGNEQRGYSRFKSLLNDFGLSDRLIRRGDRVSRKLILKPIDYNLVNKKLIQQRSVSSKFLISNLYGEQ